MEDYFVLQEQLREREQTINDLERRMEEKDRELHAIKLDNEAVCYLFVLLLDKFSVLHHMLFTVSCLIFSGLG